MNTIKPVSIGWKALGDVINVLVEAINRRTIDTGSGLTKSETENGILITLASAKASGDPGNPATGTGSTSTSTATTPTGEIAAWQQIQVMDDNCNKLSMWVWGGTPR